MGTRKTRTRQEDLWVAHRELASAPSHPFCSRLNELLDAASLDGFVEALCGRFYAEKNKDPKVNLNGIEA